MIHGLSHDDSHQTVGVGNLLCVAGLQRRQCIQERAMFVDKPEYISGVARLKACVEGIILAWPIQCFWLTPGQVTLCTVPCEVLKRTISQLPIQRLPLLMELFAQFGKLRVKGLRKPGNVQLGERGRLAFERDKFIAKVPMEMTVIQMDFTGLQLRSKLAVHPKLVPVAVDAIGFALVIKGMQLRFESVWDRPIGTF